MSPKFYGLHKIHKPDTPLRPIVSSCGSVTYGVAKELAKILKPLVGKSPHHINSTQDFVEQVKHITLAPGECLSSYDVSALFTSDPIDPALKIIKNLLVKDPTIKDRTVLGYRWHYSPIRILSKNTYFSFQGQFFEQVEGAAMVPLQVLCVACILMDCGKFTPNMSKFMWYLHVIVFICVNNMCNMCNYVYICVYIGQICIIMLFQYYRCIDRHIMWETQPQK